MCKKGMIIKYEEYNNISNIFKLYHPNIFYKKHIHIRIIAII